MHTHTFTHLICACTHLICACTHLICACTRLICAFTHLICACTHTRACMHTLAHAYTHSCTHTRTCTHTLARACTHTHALIHTYTHPRPHEEFLLVQASGWYALNAQSHMHTPHMRIHTSHTHTHSLTHTRTSLADFLWAVVSFPCLCLRSSGDAEPQQLIAHGHAPDGTH